MRLPSQITRTGRWRPRTTSRPERLSSSSFPARTKSWLDPSLVMALISSVPGESGPRLEAPIGRDACIATSHGIAPGANCGRGSYGSRCEPSRVVLVQHLGPVRLRLPHVADQHGNRCNMNGRFVCLENVVIPLAKSGQAARAAKREVRV